MKSVSKKITIDLEGDKKQILLSIPPNKKIVSMGAKLVDATDLYDDLKPILGTHEIAKVVFTDYKNKVVLAQSVNIDFENTTYLGKESICFEPFYSNYLLVRVDDIINKKTTVDTTYQIEVFAEYQ
ncbi:hypothetical protein ACE193_15230 [Bernardetia sp. OM2101]|uniref:hypothetical protein n=1 Tax=Bernardetia sp. OM2101 TaxID=3344876 RepID=UPI0035D020BB